MIVVRGVNIFPAAVEEIIRAAGDVLEYQVVVSTVQSLSELNVRIEPRPGCEAAALAGELEKRFETQFALRVPVTTVPPGTLPRFEMKAQRWIRS
jgi:phenylacetate-CoA ligase